MNTTTDIHSRKTATLALYGLALDSRVAARFRNPDGTTGDISAPAEFCFRCLSVCPGYWSLESLASYAHGHGLVKPGASVWYVMDQGKHVAA